MAVSIKTKPATSAAPDSPVLTVIAKVIKGDTYMVMADAAKELEDEFANNGLYTGEGSTLAILPPYPPRSLLSLVTHNNVLNQCVQAMEVNIDGTGHEFVSAEEGGTVDEKEKSAAADFFNEPYPGRSFISLRRDLRRDLESIGYGFLEVLRTMGKEVAALRPMDAQTIRLVRLGKQVPMKRMVKRGGKDVEITINERPRRFMQIFNAQHRQYFKEFGVPLSLSRTTGEWAEDGKSFPVDEEATELMFFGVDKDASGPYFVPRCINQLPAVVGSRKAEEQNLEFFDSGGMPPAIIFIQGGALAGESAAQLRTYLSNANKKKGRAVVVELASNSGSLESSGTVSAKVERFGAERANDSMYANYDKAAEEHVRVGFRLPPLFLGLSQDYNYATAVTAYQVAEAQVFQPERVEFDERINKSLIKALGWKTLKFKSLPITIKSVEETFKGLALLDGKVDPEEFVMEVNKTIGSDLEYKEPPEPPPAAEPLIDPHTNLPYTEPVAPQVPPAGPGGTVVPPKPKPQVVVVPIKPPVKAAKTERLQLIKLARAWAEVEGLLDPMLHLNEGEVEVVRKSVEDLGTEDRVLLTELVREYARPAPARGHDH